MKMTNLLLALLLATGAGPWAGTRHPTSQGHLCRRLFLVHGTSVR